MLTETKPNRFPTMEAEKGELRVDPMRHWSRLLALLMILLAMAACLGRPATPQATATPGAPTGTPTPAVATPTPVPSTPPVQAYARVTIPEVSLSFEVPATWERVDTEWEWQPPESGAAAQGLRIGVLWAHLQPPQEPEAVLLPQPSQITGSQPVQLAWGSGRRIQLEVFAASTSGGGQAPVALYETHVLIVVSEEGDRLAFDFYATARTSEGLDRLEPALQHMLETSARGD